MATESVLSIVVSEQTSAAQSPLDSLAASDADEDDDSGETARGGDTDLENDDNDDDDAGDDAGCDGAGQPHGVYAQRGTALTGSAAWLTRRPDPGAAPRAAPRPATYAVGVFGEYATGKTALLRRLVSNTFALETVATVGCAFETVQLRIGAESGGAGPGAAHSGQRDVQLQLWDTAGQERYHALSESIVRRVQGALVVFALDSRASYECCESWVEKLRCYDEALPLVLVGNKLDAVVAPGEAAHHGATLHHGAATPDASSGAPQRVRVVSSAEARAFAVRRGIVYVETSARTAVGVTHAFEMLAARVVAHVGTASARERTIDAAVALGATVQLLPAAMPAQGAAGTAPTVTARRCCG